jgi:hypothetical protein
MPNVKDGESSEEDGRNDNARGFLANTMGLIKEKDE